MIRITDLKAEIPKDTKIADGDGIIFHGYLTILKGGTLPHHAFRFLAAESLPIMLGRSRTRSGMPLRCSLIRDHAREEELVQFSPIHRLRRIFTRTVQDLICQEPELIRELEFRDVECLFATTAEDWGYDVTLTRATKDGGYDVSLRCHDEKGQPRRYHVELKHWGLGKRVGPQQMRDLIKVVARDAVDGALLVSTSGFSKPAQELAATTDITEFLRLVNLEEMISFIRQFSPKSDVSSLPTALLSEIQRHSISGKTK
jgi:HJR/Mrr/RecB family endonuclease